MAGITLAQAEAQLAKYLAAEEAILSGAQSYRLNTGITDKLVTKADLAAIQAGITTWNDRCQRLGRTGGIPVRRVGCLD